MEESIAYYIDAVHRYRIKYNPIPNVFVSEKSNTSGESKPKPTQDIFNSLVSSDQNPTLETLPDDLDFLGETSSAYTPSPEYEEYDSFDNLDYSFHAAQGPDTEELPENGTIVSPPKNFKAVIVKHRLVFTLFILHHFNYPVVKWWAS